MGDDSDDDSLPPPARPAVPVAPQPPPVRGSAEMHNDDSSDDSSDSSTVGSRPQPVTASPVRVIENLPKAKQPARPAVTAPPTAVQVDCDEDTSTSVSSDTSDESILPPKLQRQANLTENQDARNLELVEEERRKQMREEEERKRRMDAEEKQRQKDAEERIRKEEQEILSLKAEHVEVIAKLKAQCMEEIAKIEADHAVEVANFRASHDEESAKLRRNASEAMRRRDQLLQERDIATDQLLGREREGARLQQQLADARQDVLDHSMKLKSCQAGSRGLSRLGLPSTPLDHNVGNGLTLQAVQQRCKTLELEVTKTHDALERKQTECEKWRRRGRFPTHNSGAATTRAPESGPFALGPPADEFGIAAPTIFSFPAK